MALVTGTSAPGERLFSDPMLMMAPPVSPVARAAAWQRKHGAFRLTVTGRPNPASVIASGGVGAITRQC